MKKLCPAIFIALLLTSSVVYAQSDSYDSTEVKLIDHHTHIFSPKIRKYLVNRVEGIDSLPPLGIDQLMNTLNKGNVKKAAVLSNAYFFSKAGQTKNKDYNSVQSENARVAKAVANHSERLVGFFSFNPLSDSAFAIIENNADRKVFAGIKLHLANSDVNLRNVSHVNQLEKVFRKADSLGLGLVVHMRTQDDPYGQKDAKIFIDSVLSKAQHIPVQIAHVAGWGGYDPETDDALGVFANKASKGELNDNIYFDLSAAIRGVNEQQEKPSLKSPNWFPEKRYNRLVTQLRKIGMDQIIFGTDWPEWSPGEYKADIEEKLPLTQKEVQTILSNRAPWFE